MHRLRLAVALSLLIACAAVIALNDRGRHNAVWAPSQTKPAARALQPNTLCAKNEQLAGHPKEGSSLLLPHQTKD